MPVNNVISCNSEFPIVSVLCLFYAICVCTLLLNILLCCGTQNSKVMCLDSSVLFSPLLCHLQHVLGLCFSHSLCMAVLQAACVLGCEVWVFVAFAVSKALSVSLCSSVCVCVLQCAAPKD